MVLIFRIIAGLLSVFSLMCFVRVIITWIPSVAYTKAAFFLSKICDPYMNFFRRYKFLKFGSFDFSPALALCLLGAMTSLVSSVANDGRFSLGIILALVMQMIFGILNSIIVFVIILFIIRLVLLFVCEQEGTFIKAIDSSIYSTVYRIAKTFTGGKMISYKNALIVAICTLVAIDIALNVVVQILITYIASIPA